jgi:hypothetical protein
MTKRKSKSSVPHTSDPRLTEASFYFDLLPKLGKQDEQMREAMEILRHPWAKAVLDPDTDRHQAQIALANLIKKAYRLGLANVKRAAGGGKRYPTDTGMNDGEESSTKPKIDNKPKKDDRPAFQSNGKRMPHNFKPSEEQLWLKKDAELKKEGKACYDAAWRRAALIARDLKYLEKWEVKTPISDPDIRDIWPVSAIRKHIGKHGK